MAAAAWATPLNYAQRAVNVRCGVLVVDSQQFAGHPANYNPYVWFNLDSNRNAKPAGWNFFNPFPLGQVTPEVVVRWTAINTALASGIAPVLGARLTKRDAPYWEVFLSRVSDEELGQYDALHLSVQGFLALNSTEREKLRKFLEGGGVLWVDVAGGAVQLDLVNQFPLPFNLNGVSSGAPLSADYTHPIMNTPSIVSANNLFAMQSEALWGLRDVDLAAAGFGQLGPIERPTEYDFARFYHIAADGLGPFLSVGKVGDGFLVVTSRGVARTLNRTQRLVSNQVPGGTYVPNNVSVAETPYFDRTSDAAARIVANMAHLASGFPQFAGGARKTNGGPIDVGAPLLKRFDAPYAFDPGPTNYVPPAVFKGLVVVSTGSQIRVYDAVPSRDLDRDGNPDDGVQDLAFGFDYDLVWTSAVLPAPVSPPSCAEVPDGAVVNQVSVVDGSGRLLIFEAFPASFVNVAPVLSAGPPANYSPPNPGDLQRGPYSPTFHDGLYFVADDVDSGLGGVVGRVWIANARDGTVVTTIAPWAVGGPGTLAMQRPSSAPTVGDVPIQDNSGGLDTIVYLSSRPAALPGPTNNAGITSLWFGVRGERPTQVTPVGNQLVVVTRASAQGLKIFIPPSFPSALDGLGLRVTAVDAAGNPMDAATLDSIFAGAVTENAGILSFTLEPTGSWPAGASLRLDYTIDWGTGVPATQTQIVRGQVNLPDDTNRRRLILDHMALSATGVLHLVAADPQDTTNANGHDGGTYYAFREEGRGAFRLINRHDLYPAHTVTLNQARPVQYAEALFDTDELQTFAPPFLGGPFSRLRFRSGPVVVGDTVYVTATGTKAGVVPCSIVMAFQADPDTAEILVPEITGSFTLLQPDFARTDNRTQPTVFSVIQPNQYVYEPNAGGGKARIRLMNLSPNQRGAVLNAFSRSLPVIVRRAGQPDLFIEPDRSGSKWSTMLWYIVYHGYENRSPATVTGNTLFIAANSRLPAILSGAPFPWPTTGLLVGMDATISPSDPFLVSNPQRPWLRQLWQLDRDNPVPGDIRGNPDIRWPQTRGVTRFEEWRQRLFQTTLTGPNGASSDAFGVIGGDGALFSWGPIGLWGFTRADFLIADESRLVRIDSSGNPVWSSDASAASGTHLDSGAAANVKPLIRPTRAYQLNSREMMIVDTGGDRVAIVDASGRESRSIEGFRLDTQFVPDGYEPGETLSLRQPRDIFAYDAYVPTASNPYSNPSATGLEYWVRYLIADAGNQRIVEMVDRYRADLATRRVLDVVTDGTGQRALGVLSWHSPKSLSGRNFQYTSLASVYDAVAPPFPRWRFAAGIGSALPTRAGLGLDTPSGSSVVGSQEGNGGIVIFDQTGAIEEVINEVFVPDVAANVYWDPATLSFVTPAEPGHTKRLGNLRSVTMRYVIDPNLNAATLAVMFADVDGVFEVMKIGSQWTVRWMLPKRAYRVLRRTVIGNVPTDANPRDFMPTYARRLDSGEVVIVNGYVGRTIPPANAEFQGEVLQVDGSLDLTNNNAQPGFSFSKQNLGFNWFSIAFQLPPVTGVRGLVIPVFADRR